MKIAFNPSTVVALTTPPNNKDITFDLRGRNIFARGVKFCGTDTWRDIKINNVSIGSNILDLRNGSNTTLTNTNGVVTINSTWRPVVDNLTSDSTTSSLTANQGRILAELINGKSDSEHTHDDRYLKLTGGTMASNALITFADSGSWGTDKGPQGARGGLYWTGQSDYAKLYAEETAGDNLDLVIQFGDDNSNGLSIRNKANTQTSYISASGVIITGTFKGNLDWSYITNKPSSYTPSVHTHSWTSITDKLVGNEFNIVNTGFNNRMWFNYLPINDRNKTATINSYYFGNGHTGLASVTASGFVKNGSSSSYVLLGDGGHQTISSLSVSYANSAGNADYIRKNALPTPANNTVKAYKDSLVKFFKNYPNGIGANVSVSNSIISHWSDDAATYYDSSTYSVIKISGYYDGVTYGQFLLSSYNLSQVGIVGRNNSQWSKIKWLAYEDQIPTDNNQLANGAGYITSAGSCAYATSAGNADTVDGYHANGLLTALSNSNNGISITVGGTTKSISNISVNYANSAGSVAWDNVTGKPTMPSNITATTAQIVTISGSTVTVNASLDAYKTPGEFNIFGTSNGDYAKMYVQSGIGDAFNGTRVITQTIKVTISHNTYAEICDVTRQYKSNAWSKWTIMYLGND